MRKRMLCLTVSVLLLLCGCERDLPLETTISLEVNFPTEPLREIAFSKWNMDDFTFETTCNVQVDGVYTRYSGEIVDEEIKTQLWEMLCEQEQMATYQGGSWGGGTLLTLTDKRTGEAITAHYTIWYESPEVEGGPICFVVSGASCGTACYYPIDHEEDREIGASERFESLLTEGVKREENMVQQNPAATAPEWSLSTIVLVNVYSNWAEGFQYYGNVIDLEGNVFSFDFSDDPDQAISWEDAGLMLYEQYEDGGLTHTGTVDENSIWECWTLGNSVNPDAPMSEEWTACDAGQWTLCLFDMEKGTLIPLSSTGDYKRELMDAQAQEIVELYQGLYE